MVDDAEADVVLFPDAELDVLGTRPWKGLEMVDEPAQVQMIECAKKEKCLQYLAAPIPPPGQRGVINGDRRATLVTFEIRIHLREPREDMLARGNEENEIGDPTHGTTRYQHLVWQTGECATNRTKNPATEQTNVQRKTGAEWSDLRWFTNLPAC